MTILTGDLDAAAFQRFWDRRDFPVAGADVRGVGQEVRTLARVEALGALDPHGQQLLTARLELARQLDHQRQRLGGEDVFVAGLDLAGDLHACRQSDGGLRHMVDLRKKILTSIPNYKHGCCGCAPESFSVAARLRGVLFYSIFTHKLCKRD
jgi:hypothetical protein